MSTIERLSVGTMIAMIDKISIIFFCYKVNDFFMNEILQRV